ncbi:MAG: hypothetical protein M1824_001015 [Vezdaea acicularis]|nr:MAG: hypothetical protein M1824_001015 [Vezdaea acicularis]
MTFNAKNLSYELKEPSFLRKLKSQYGGQDGQRHERPTARPKRAREDEDDAPTYVDEESRDTISKEDYEAMIGVTVPKEDSKATSAKRENRNIVAREGDNGIEEGSGDLDFHLNKAEKPNPDSAVLVKKETSGLSEAIADVGARKKKKAIRVIGESEVDTARKIELIRRRDEPKKRGKKVKLSFDDQEGV